LELQNVRVRFAPSPTGRMHLGSARTALYDYLYARRQGGKFVLRIEDTDRKRFVPQAEQELIDGLDWLGLHYDEGPGVGGAFGPYRQTERLEIYRQHAARLVEAGKAFPCFCTPDRLERIRQEQLKQKQNPHYDGTCRQLDPGEAARRIQAGERHVVRLKTPQEGATTVVDLLRGSITVENKMIDDSILIKSDGYPTYHFAAMVDDHLMEITHVIRGSEWQSTLPLHALVLRAFGWEEPVWVHLSVFLKPSGKGKMSKRDAAQAIQDGHSIFIGDLKSLGYIPEGVLNWIVLMGWGVAENDVMTLDEMVQRFDIAGLNPAPAAVDFAKLDHFNATHIRALQPGDLASRLKPYFQKAGCQVEDARLLQIIPLLRERLVTLDDCIPFGAFFFREQVDPQPGDLVGKNLTAKGSAEVLRHCLQVLEALAVITPDTAEAPMRSLVKELGLTAGQVFGILRAAVTGQTVSPPLFESMAVIGKKKVVERIRSAIAILEKMG